MGSCGSCSVERREHDKRNRCAQRGQGDVRPLREHALKMGARGTSTSARQSSIDVEIVLRRAQV
jgi:hypothetical protein